MFGLVIEMNNKFECKNLNAKIDFD